MIENADETLKFKKCPKYDLTAFQLVIVDNMCVFRSFVFYLLILISHFLMSTHLSSIFSLLVVTPLPNEYMRIIYSTIKDRNISILILSVNHHLLKYNILIFNLLIKTVPRLLYFLISEKSSLWGIICIVSHIYYLCTVCFFIIFYILCDANIYCPLLSFRD